MTEPLLDGGSAAAPRPGFLDPMGDAQQTFRAVMNALARPGLAQEIDPRLKPPAPMSPVTGAIVLTLADEETALWLDDALAGSDEVLRWLAFHCGAPVTTDPARAAFAVVAANKHLPELAAFNQGTAEYPDRSTTVIVTVDGFDDGKSVVLSGPGIEAHHTLAVEGLGGGFWDQAAANRGRFPLGVDVLFAGPASVVGLPRSTAAAQGD